MEMICQHLACLRLKNIYLAILIAVFAQSLTLQIAQADEKLSDLRVLWQQGNYSEVVDRLRKYRHEPYGQLPEVDYMIATSLCRLDKRQEAARRFDYVLKHYRLGEDSKIVESERQQCGATQKPRVVNFITLGSTAGVEGKSYGWLMQNFTTDDQAISRPLSSQPIRVVRVIPPETFSKRLFDFQNKDAAVQHVKSLFGPKTRIVTVGPFIVASSGRQSLTQLSNIGRSLEEYARYFESQYGMLKPDKFITIYLVPDINTLGTLAGRLHGIEISKVSIGYAFPLDRSIVATIPGTIHGTLKHELFHLMLRSNFGDAPAWLEEGMAALFEDSKIVGGKAIGRPNWRGQVIDNLGRVSVQSIVTMNWSKFDGAFYAGKPDEQAFEPDYAGELKSQAINHATARYFILYLQEKGKLAEAYKLFRDREIDQLEDDLDISSIHLIESVFREGKLKPDIEEINRNFEGWLRQLRNRYS